jgi:hypothetical protein
MDDGEAYGDILVYGAIAVTAVSLYYIFTTMSIPEIPASLGATFGTILPGLLITGLAIVGAVEVRRGPAAMGAFSVAGVGLALTLYELNSAGIVTATMLLPATLAQVQVLVVVLGFIMGVVAYRS